MTVSDIIFLRLESKLKEGLSASKSTDIEITATNITERADSVEVTVELSAELLAYIDEYIAGGLANSRETAIIGGLKFAKAMQELYQDKLSRKTDDGLVNQHSGSVTVTPGSDLTEPASDLEQDKLAGGIMDENKHPEIEFPRPPKNLDKEIFFGEILNVLRDNLSEAAKAEGFDVYGWFVEWASEPVPALGGRRPFDLFNTVEGRAEVSSLIGYMISGTFA